MFLAFFVKMAGKEVREKMMRERHRKRIKTEERERESCFWPI